ncbi:MAG: PEP/pyruvate-binding domain-containing protein [Bacillota bacterium]|jgi:hypothetical protein
MFRQASSGIPGLDKVLDHLRLGDNVVWQVDRIEDYNYFASAFARAALASGRRLVYLRFGQQPPVVEEDGQGRFQTYRIDPGRGFEYFSASIRELITALGNEVFYVFDSLSDLLIEWSTDLMIGNFFMVTCPYLYQLDTVSYFALLRHHHSYRTIARIRETTQLLLDVYHKKSYYIHPLKVWQRYSPTMFLPHRVTEGEFYPLTSSTDVSQLFANYPGQSLGNAERKLDYWDRVFIKAAELMGTTAADREVKPVLEQLLKMVISREPQLIDLAKRYLTLADLLQIKTRLIGSGFIGGKAVGLLLARAILRADRQNGWEDWLEPHDSFYVGADVYYTYLVENGCWELRQEQKQPENYYSAAARLQQRLLNGDFPETVREQLLEMLEYFGQSPIIVRSSSLLEDSFGNAFAGKYESVFCVNQGTLQERYQQLVAAIRVVYASTLNENALAYRAQRGLAESDEQMALLIQRVSGSHRHSYFFPDLAGVALSHNIYVWNRELDPAAGMLRLVLGLGTRAVDRMADDYARLVALDRPLLRADAHLDDLLTYSQHNVDLLDLSANQAATVDWQALVEHNLINRLELLAEPERGCAGRWVLNFEQFFRTTDFAARMRAMLQVLQTAYGYPVDTEFTLNFTAAGGYSVNLLQCRPLQVKCNQQPVQLPETLPDGRLVLASQSRFLGGSVCLKATHLLYVVPEIYAGLRQSDQYQVARIVGRINQQFGGKAESTALLFGPGRWGTSTPSLGVPVAFAELNHFATIGEVAFKTAGFVPEISYGTHFFHDLVETGIFYLVVDPDDATTHWQPEVLTGQPNFLAEYIPDAAKWETVIRLLDLAKLGIDLWLGADVRSQQVMGWIGS